MPYYVVKDFARGLDARRLLETTEVGALVHGTNAHISRGGEFEKRRAFAPWHHLAPGTHGLWVDDDGVVTVFGSTERPSELHPAILYIECQHPDTATAMHRVLSVDSFFGKPYIVAEYADGTVHHYWNGDRITDTGVPLDYVPENETDPDPEVPEPPTPDYPVGNGRSTAVMSLYYSSGGGEVQIKRVGIARVGTAKPKPKNPLAGGPKTFEFYDIVDVAEMPLDVDQQDVAAAVKTLADKINAYTGGKVDCHASASFNQLTVSVAEYGTLYDNWVLKIEATKNLGTDPENKVSPFKGGSEQPPPVVPPGEPAVPEVPIEFRWSPGRFATAHKAKMHATSGTLLYFSAIDNAVMWTPDATGAGFIDVSTHAKGNQRLTSLGEYQSFLAVFCSKQVQLWLTDPDPRRYQLSQTVANTGTDDPNSVIEFGSGELFYLDRSGVRAISARAQENIAYMSDAGSMIDAIVTEQLATLSAADRGKAIGCVEPQDGRLWMIVRDRIYVLSFFPSSRISAWTIYEPGFTIDYVSATSNLVWLRSGDTIFVYGGLTGTEYGEDYDVVGQLPFLDFAKPATTKVFTSIDLALSGTWYVEGGLDPTRPLAFATIGTIDKSTYSYGRHAFYGAGTHASLRFTHRGPGPARVGACVFHYTESEAA